MKSVAILLAEGFEEIEALATYDIIKRAGFVCHLVGLEEEYVRSCHDLVVKVDKVLDSHDFGEIELLKSKNNIQDLEDYDMIVLPGGMPGATNLADNKDVIKALQSFDKQKEKYIAAICASPAIVLTRAGIDKDRTITCYPGMESHLDNANFVEELVVREGDLVTSRGPATSFLFAYTLVDLLGGNSENLKEGMLWNLLEKEE